MYILPRASAATRPPVRPQVKWEEAWWEVTDWTGMRELGARKSGNKEDSSAWREEWNERISHDEDTLKMVIERDAHK